MARYLGIEDESTFGTPVTPPTVFLDVEKIGLHAERNEVSAQGMTPLGPLATMPGEYKITGDIVMAPSSVNIMKFLKYLVGDATTTDDASSHYKHVFDPESTLYFGTMYKGLEFCAGTAADMLQYTSTICISSRWELARGAPAKVTFGMFGQKDAKVTAIAMGTLSTVRPFFSLDATLYWDIAEAEEITNIDSISFNFNRSVADDAYAMNDPFLKCFLGGAPEANGEMDVIFNNWDAYENFWGATSGPVAQPANVALVIELTGPSLGGAGEFANHDLKIQCPAVAVNAIDDPVELRNKILQTCSLSCARGQISSDTVLARFTVHNDVSDA
jgi:hypothetical protein